MLFGIVFWVLTTVVCVLYVPTVRQAVLDIGIAVAREQTGLDIDLGHIYLSPFHHSPLTFYRAYKGDADLPIDVQIDSLFIGHRGQDTLLYTRSLRLKATAQTANIQSPISNLQFPIILEQLLLDSAVIHSDSLIEAVGIDGMLGLLTLNSPQIIIADGQYPIRDLCLYDADVAIDLRPTQDSPEVDSLPKDTTPLMMAFDVPNADIRNVRFRLNPMGIDVNTRSIVTNALADVGANRYEARRLEVGNLTFTMNDLRIPVDTVRTEACVDLEKNLITSDGIYVRSDEMGAEADLSEAQMDLTTMQVSTTGAVTYQGNQARLRASYDIDEEVYDATVHIGHVDLSPFVTDLPLRTLTGDIEASGRGIDPRKMQNRVQVHLDSAVYDTYDLSHLDITTALDNSTSVAVTLPSLQLDVRTPMSLFTFLDSLSPLLEAIQDSDLYQPERIRHLIPAIQTDLHIARNSPAQAILDSLGVDFDQLSLAIRSDADSSTVHLSPIAVTLPPSLRLPTAEAALDVTMTDSTTDAFVTTNTFLTDGASDFYGLCTDAAFRMDVHKVGQQISGTGLLMLDSLAYGDKEFGNRAVDIRLSSSDTYANAILVEVHPDELPLELMDGFVTLPDIDLHGAVRASASVDGLPFFTDISAQVQPVGIKAQYIPYAVDVRLGETPIIMQHNKVDLNGLPIYMVDSTFIALNGGLDLDSMRLNIRLDADSLVPVSLPAGGPLPVHGVLATDLHGTVSGALDSIIADVEVSLLPSTDITYPIDKKNLAQVKPHGAVTVHCPVASIDSLALHGRIHVDDGKVLYSPKIYPIMPFRLDSGSHVVFNGPIGQTQLNISASQKVKADVESEEEETRRVDFVTGVRVHGALDTIGLKSIAFFLEAPDDEAITRELATVDEGTREGLAATLLATGMYVGESNVAAQRSGYALSSIINSRINAALANSKVGKVIDIDVSSAQSTHAGGTTNDMNISISKSFFKDRLRLTLGSTLTDNPEINSTSGLLNSFSADYKLTKDGNVQLRLFSQRDYNNVLEGELYKSGLAVRAAKDWKRKEWYRSDSIIRTYGLTADAGVAYRSNNSIGPDLTLKSSIKNILGHGETFTLKGNGAYYWALRNRHPGDPRKTDTYKLGLNASLIFPYLHWKGDHNPQGDTRYMLGYQYENIAGGYGVHKITGSFSYFIRSANSPYITHAFTPFSLSVVRMKAESDSLLDKAAEYPQLIKVIAGDEFIPSIAYNFIYNDYRAKRHVNTFLNLGIKESGNILNALYCALGYKWEDVDKPFGKISFNQFVKLQAELRNKFNFTDKVSIATRLFAGANIPVGNSNFTPLSEAFYTGGPNSLRAATAYAYGPGNFYSAKYNQNFFHSGDVKLEANFELRFPIVWKLYGAAFVDAGNVWNWLSLTDMLKAAGMEEYITKMEIPETLRDGILNNPEWAKQIALGTGAGLRLDIDGLVVRLDIGVAIHVPYQTYRYDKEGKPDYNAPITTYFNIPSALDAIRINFGIGYPF